MAGGVFGVPRVVEQSTQVDMGVCVVGVEPQGFAIRADGLERVGWLDLTSVGIAVVGFANAG